jgi:release factor glutamine methyltransferase
LSSILEILQRDIPRVSASLELDASAARIEVQSLLQHVLQVPRAYLPAHSEQILDTQQQTTYDAFLLRRLQGEPVAYLLGEREFFGLNFKVTPATLIPRPDTELLVELALQRLPKDKACRVMDLGTGSGAIGLSIGHSRPDVAVTAVDASEAALEVARENAQRLGVVNVSFLRSNWFSALGGQCFDLIISNPPYVAARDEHLTQGDVRFEPLSALASGTDGLDDIRCIASQAATYLEQGAWLLLEHGYDQAAQVRDIFLSNGFVEIFSAKDIAGIDRVRGGVKPRQA